MGEDGETLADEQLILMGFVEQQMTDVCCAWNTVRNAITWQDYGLLQRIVDKRIPFPMVNPKSLSMRSRAAAQASNDELLKLEEYLQVLLLYVCSSTVTN